jgi:hypothetical protein
MVHGPRLAERGCPDRKRLLTHQSFAGINEWRIDIEKRNEFPRRYARYFFPAAERALRFRQQSSINIL